jgi:hypothetical protein
LLANLLIAERDRILARLKPGGALVVAGILKSEFGEVATAYQTAGMKLVASGAKKEWRSGAFKSALCGIRRDLKFSATPHQTRSRQASHASLS